MFLMIISLLVWVPSLLGFGLLIRGLAISRSEVSGFEGMAFCFLWGIAFVMALAMFLHLFMPLGGWISSVIVVVGWFSLFCHRHFLKKFELIYIFAILILSSFTVYLAYQTDQHYDTGLYHLQTLQWYWEAPAVKGLANLHHRFGFNSGWHAFCAILSLPEIGLAAAFSGDVLITTILMAVFFAKGIRGINEGRLTVPSATSLAIFFVLCQRRFALAGNNLGGPTTDLPAALLVLLCLTVCLSAIDDLAVNVEDALLLACLAIFVKLSTIPVVLLPLFLLIWRSQKLSGRCYIFLCTAVLTWVIHSVVLSGCLVFPLKITRLGFLPWACPVQHLTHAADCIKSWARAECVEKWVLTSWNWLPIWFGHVRSHWLWPLIGLCYFAAGAVIFTGCICRCWKAPNIKYWFVWVGSIVGVLFWFFNGPDPRFGLGFLLFCGVFPLAWSVAGLKVAFSPAWGRRFGWVLVLIMAAMWENMRHYQPHSICWCDWPRIPKVEVVKVSDIWRPVAGDQCWGAPIPCSPEQMDGRRLVIDIDSGLPKAILPAK